MRLLNTPNGGMTLVRANGHVDESRSLYRTVVWRLWVRGRTANLAGDKEFDRLEQFAKLKAPPPVKFKDLEEVVSHKISYKPMPFDVRADFVKVTGDTVLGSGHHSD